MLSEETGTVSEIMRLPTGTDQEDRRRSAAAQAKWVQQVHPLTLGHTDFFFLTHYQLFSVLIIIVHLKP